MDSVSACHRAVHTHAPLIQCITNTVVQQFSANVLLAIGAAPAMFDHEADATEFARVADGVLVNFGTADRQQFLGADAAIDGAQDTATPWVLDPVSVGVGSYRTARIRAAAQRRPTVIRGNASEITGLAQLGGGARGTDATDSVDSALPAAAILSRRLHAVVAVSGAVDAIVDARRRDDNPDGEAVAGTPAPVRAGDRPATAGLSGEPDGVRVARVAGGHELMPVVIGTGCALGATAAAYAGAGAKDGIDAFDSVIAAHAHFAAAGSAAGAHAAGPGTFAQAFLDELYSVGGHDLAGVAVSNETIRYPNDSTPAGAAAHAQESTR